MPFPLTEKVSRRHSGSQRWEAGRFNGPAEIDLKEAPGVSPATLYMNQHTGISCATAAGTIEEQFFNRPSFFYAYSSEKPRRVTVVFTPGDTVFESNHIRYLMRIFSPPALLKVRPASASCRAMRA